MRVERCLWCGQRRDDLRAMPHQRQYEGVVVPTHAPIRACADHIDDTHAYLLRVASNSRWTLLVSILAVLLVIGGGMARADALVAFGLLVLGAGILLFPYCTPEAVRRLGARQGIRIARVIGLVVGMAGIALLAYTLLTA